MSLINVGPIDRISRLTLGLTLALAGFAMGAFQGNGWGMVCEAFGLILLITGVVGVCPLYMPFGFRTSHDKP